jgi:hypothetical protein
MRHFGVGGALLVCALLAWSSSSAFSQSLVETAAYILSSGRAEPGDLKKIDDNTVQFTGQASAQLASSPSITGRDLPKMRLDVIRSINRRQCEFANLNVLQSGRMLPTMNFYFNKIIIGELSEQPRLFSDQSVLRLVGEDEIACAFNLDDRGTGYCTHEFSVSPKTAIVPKMRDALNYLYSNFCTSAKRKSAS